MAATLLSRRLLLVATSLAVTILLCPAALAQNVPHWPEELGQQPSVVEVMNWLERNSLAQARVGVRTMSRGASQSEFVPMLSQDALPNYSLFFAEGFKLAQVEGCHVILRNNETTMIDSKNVSDSNAGERLRAEVFVPLYRMSVTAGKRPYQHTKDPQKYRVLGTWRTQYKTNRPREDVVLTLFLPSKPEKTVWEADSVTFTFENKDTSQTFDAVFRYAIRLCQKKRS